MKYRKYIWNYTRLSIPYQYAFLIKVLDELSDIRRLGYHAYVWKAEEKETLERIINDPDEFFKITGKGYEDSRLSLLSILNHSISIKYFQEAVKKFQDIYIYGAGQLGQKTWDFLKKMGVGFKVNGFIVSDLKNNLLQIDDKSVQEFSKMQNQYYKEVLVIVALHKRYHYEVALKLQEVGYLNVLLIDDDMKSWIYNNKDI